MFKKAFILVAILLFSASVFSVRLIDPLSKELSLTESNFVGTAAPNSTLELIISKELVDKYESLSIENALPVGFDYDVLVEKESIKLFIHVPWNASVGTKEFSILLSGPNKSDVVPLNFEVVKGALAVSPSDISIAKTSVNSSAKFDLFFVNNTDSDAVFSLSDDLPGNWVNVSPLEMKGFSKEVIVPRKSNLTESIVVYPRLQGVKKFNVTVKYEDTSSVFSFAVEAKPTLKSKLESVIYGMPFYSFSLLPSYFVNGLLSFYVN